MLSCRLVPIDWKRGPGGRVDRPGRSQILRHAPCAQRHNEQYLVHTWRQARYQAWMPSDNYKSFETGNRALLKFGSGLCAQTRMALHCVKYAVRLQLRSTYLGLKIAAAVCTQFVAQVPACNLLLVGDQTGASDIRVTSMAVRQQQPQLMAVPYGAISPMFSATFPWAGKAVQLNRANGRNSRQIDAVALRQPQTQTQCNAVLRGRPLLTASGRYQRHSDALPRLRSRGARCAGHAIVGVGLATV